MVNYARLSPRDALAAWYAQRNVSDPNTLDMTDLAKQNPGAWQLLKTGVDTGDGKTRKIFNPNTGQWDTQQKHGWLSHPESWLQLGLGAGMGAAVIGPAAAAGTLVGHGAALAPEIATAAGGTGAFVPTTAAGLTAASSAAPAAAGGGAMSFMSGPVGSQLVRGGFDLFGSLFSGKAAANGQTEAARIAADSAKYAADLQAKANEQATAFTREQAENTWQNSEAARHGNYDQWAAGQRRLGTVGDYLGLGPREIPAYVPGTDPGFTSGAPGATSVGSGATPAAAAASSSGDPVIDALTANYAALGVKPTGPGSGPTDIAYMAQRMRETGGATPDNLKYWVGPQGRIAAELAKAAGGGGQAPAAAAALPGAAGDYLTGLPFASMPIAPALRMPGAAAAYL